MTLLRLLGVDQCDAWAPMEAVSRSGEFVEIWWEPRDLEKAIAPPKTSVAATMAGPDAVYPQAARAYWSSVMQIEWGREDPTVPAEEAGWVSLLDIREYRPIRWRRLSLGPKESSLRVGMRTDPIPDIFNDGNEDPDPRLVEMANEAVGMNLDDRGVPIWNSAQGYACALSALMIYESRLKKQGE